LLTAAEERKVSRVLCLATFYLAGPTDDERDWSGAREWWAGMFEEDLESS
jgi:hypothetical protein